MVSVNKQRRLIKWQRMTFIPVRTWCTILIEYWVNFKVVMTSKTFAWWWLCTINPMFGTGFINGTNLYQKTGFHHLCKMTRNYRKSCKICMVLIKTKWSKWGFYSIFVQSSFTTDDFRSSLTQPSACFKIKMSYGYRDSRYKDTMVVSIGILILKVSRSCNHLILILGILIPVRR